MNRSLMAFTCVLAFATAPGGASADGFIAPYVGTLFGGTLGGVDDEERPYTFGVSMGSMGGGIFGVEADVAFAPHFFGATDGRLIGETSVTTGMANVLLGAPIGGQRGGGVRPYATAGVGVIRQKVGAYRDFLDVASTDLAYNLGGGVMIFVADRAGVRGEVRYFRNFRKSDEGVFAFEAGAFNFTRATLGAVLRF